jgi:carbon monoxide dehydrogenase subunit G
MKVEGEISVDAPRDAVFSRLSDARFFASCVDGVSELTEIDATHYSARFATKIAYMRFNFKVNVEMSRLAPPEEIEAKVDGAPMGMVGRLTASAATRLTEAGGKTGIHYVIDVALTGKLGSIGQPVLKAKAKEMEKQFAQRLSAAFAGGAAEAAR